MAGKKDSMPRAFMPFRAQGYETTVGSKNKHIKQKEHLKDKQIINRLLDLLWRRKSREVEDSVQELCEKEWQEIVELASLHGIAPFLYSRLKSFSAETNIHPEIFKQLRDNYLKSAGRNTLLYHELSEVLRVLTDAGIPVILLKGAYLAENAYKDIALRPMQDIDILLEKDDLQQGEKVLKTLGYSSSRDFLPGVDTDNYQHLLPLYKKNGIPIEIHWYLSNPRGPFRIDMDGVWERAQICKIGDQKTKTLCPEDLLLYLCIHCAYQHCFEMGLIQICDIMEVIQEFEKVINWDQLLSRASEWGCSRVVYLTYIMTEKLLGYSLPAKVSQKIESENIDHQIISATYMHMFSTDGSGGLAPSLPKVKESERIAQKLSVVVERIFPSRKEMARLYPVKPSSPRVYFYYPVRFKDLLTRYGKGFWKIFVKDRAIMDSVQHRMKGEELRAWMQGKD